MAPSKRYPLISKDKPRAMRNRFEQYLYNNCDTGTGLDRYYMSDEQINEQLREWGIPKSQWSKWRRRFDADMNRMIDQNGGKIRQRGRKPLPDEDPTDENVQVIRIPDTDNLVIRFWNGGLDQEGQFCMDIYNTKSKDPVNSFELGFSFHVTPVSGTLSVLCAGRLTSWEANAGIPPKQLLPGEERFSIVTGALCTLKRPGKKPFLFEVPQRPRIVPEGVQVARPVPLRY